MVSTGGRQLVGRILTATRESSINSSSSGNKFHQQEARLIEGDNKEKIYSVSFLVDGKHFVSGGNEGTIRRWRIEDGKEVGTPMHAKSPTLDIAVSQDGKWIVSGTMFGLVTVWSAESYSKVTEWKAHSGQLCAVDVSPDATKVATGSTGKTACVWSLSTSERLLGPLTNDNGVVAVKFSPDGCFIAIATWATSVRICDSQSGRLLVEFPIKVSSLRNQSLAWASDNKQLFVLSRDCSIHCLDVSTGTTLSKRPINNSKDAQCIALASNGTFIAASTLSSVSFWDTTTHKKIDYVIYHAVAISSMAISSNYDLAIAGGNLITVRNLCGLLPSPYCDDVSALASNVHCAE